MTDKPLTAKQASFVQYYADSGSESYHNAMQSAIKAGYSHKTANNSVKQILGSIGVKEAIDAYKAKTTAKLDHNRTIAIKLLNENITALDAIIEEQPNNVAAVTARTGAIRELNAISMLHGSSVTVNAEAPVDIPAEDLEQIQEQARQSTLKLA